MKISRFGHTAVRARDALKTARFYQEMFDAEEAFRMHREDGSTQRYLTHGHRQTPVS